MVLMTKEADDTKRYGRAFWRGWFSVFLPLGGASSELPDLDKGFERDCEALAGDWQRIGGDLRRAVKQFSHEN
jgi:hypothetical protein